jgi:endonuclease III
VTHHPFSAILLEGCQKHWEISDKGEHMKYTDEFWDGFFNQAKQALVEVQAKVPAVSIIQEEQRNPFAVLVSTLLSLRTKDDVTLEASKRILSIAPTPQAMLQLDAGTIEETIFPVGFYHTKAANLQKISKILISQYNGEVPSSAEKMMKLPGVGIKTANLVLNLGFGIDAICVDCHVHQISNRLGWIETKTPEQSEKELQKVMPRRYWIALNELLVTYGQNICTSVSPHCSKCPFASWCPKIGVGKTR